MFKESFIKKNEWGDNENLQPFISLLVSKGSKKDEEMGITATATRF